MSCGCYSDEKPVDEECIEVFRKVKDNLKYNTIRCVSYKTQIVNGINYLIKILLDNGKHLIIKVFVDLNNETTLIEQYLSEDY